jgi:hypothetical protein
MLRPRTARPKAVMSESVLPCPECTTAGGRRGWEPRLGGSANSRSWGCSRGAVLLASGRVEFSDVAPVLRAVARAEAAGTSLDLAAVAGGLSVSDGELLVRLDTAEAWGLVLWSPAGGSSGLLEAGRQYLESHGEVDGATLRFLAGHIDNLHARASLLRAGTALVDEFRAAVLHGRAVEHARTLVPQAFAVAVTERIALDLFAASVALMARLSAGARAGCVAEEIVAVALLDEAREWLAMRARAGELDEGAARAAIDKLRGLFELFEDDDVLRVFEMREPADAAVV